jgi:hypothetical protein
VTKRQRSRKGRCAGGMRFAPGGGTEVGTAVGSQALTEGTTCGSCRWRASASRPLLGRHRPSPCAQAASTGPYGPGSRPREQPPDGPAGATWPLTRELVAIVDSAPLSAICSPPVAHPAKGKRDPSAGGAHLDKGPSSGRPQRLRSRTRGPDMGRFPPCPGPGEPGSVTKCRRWPGPVRAEEVGELHGFVVGPSKDR